MNKAIITTVIILIGLSVYFFYLKSTVPEYEPTYSITELKSDTLNASIYLKKKVWGIASNHEVIVISSFKNSEFEPDLETDYIFATGTPLIYKLANDTLIVYTRVASKVPKNFDSDFKIEQIILSNKEMLDLNRVYSEKGLNKL